MLQSLGRMYGQGGARGCEARQSTDSLLRLDVRRMVQSVGASKPLREAHGGTHVPDGVWSWGEDGDGGTVAYELVLHCTGGALKLNYFASGATRVDRIRLSTTPCHFGGVRWWAHCPRCDRRCGVLWGDGSAFACRACHGLAYASSQLSKANRFERKVRRLADRLHAPGDCHRDPYERPRGMRRHVYARLKEQLREAKEREVGHLRRSVREIAASLYRVCGFEWPSTAALARHRRNQRRRDKRARERAARGAPHSAARAVDDGLR